MAENVSPVNPAFGEAGSPSAPPGDSFYPALNMEAKDYPEDLPPPYTLTTGHASSQGTPQRTPQGPAQVPTQRNLQPTPISSVAPIVANNQNGVPAVVASTNLPQQVQVVLQNNMDNVPPGICHVCRRGKIRDRPTCCSWVACCFLLPFGIIPGLVAFCYAGRKPKCTRCGFVHGKKK